jgi:hypothetical protein
MTPGPNAPTDRQIQRTGAIPDKGWFAYFRVYGPPGLRLSTEAGNPGTSKRCDSFRSISAAGTKLPNLDERQPSRHWGRTGYDADSSIRSRLTLIDHAAAAAPASSTTTSRLAAPDDSTAALRAAAHCRFGFDSQNGAGKGRRIRHRRYRRPGRCRWQCGHHQPEASACA